MNRVLSISLALLLVAALALAALEAWMDSQTRRGQLELRPPASHGETPGSRIAPLSFGPADRRPDLCCAR